jgi:hypothetical protein
MVHALREICRVLTQQGTIIDLRPLTGSWPVEVISGRARQQAGNVTGVPSSVSADAAANRAMEQASAEGLVRREREELFDFSYYWDSPGEMKEFVDEEWDDFVTIEPDVWQGIRHHWTLADADARVRVRLSVLISRWQKVG